MADQEESPISYEDLANIEEDFEEIDTEIVRQQYTLSAPAYAARATAIAQISNFWPLVFEQAPPELDSFISASDSQIFGESLLSLNVTRPEIASGGHPRSLKIEFQFKENEFFADEVLSKNFWYRRAKDGWTGLVSEPVKVNWKKGKDLSEGLTDAAVALFEARKKAGDYTKQDGLKEYNALKEKLETLNGANTSFFTWFGWVSSRRYVSTEENDAAVKAHQERRAKRKAGERVEAPPQEKDEEEDANGDEEVEVHEAGEHVAVTLAEDLWPNAIKFFTQAQELGEMSDVDFEEMDEDDAEESGEDEPVDIRALVGKGKKNGGRVSDGGQPPAKKQKK